MGLGIKSIITFSALLVAMPVCWGDGESDPATEESANGTSQAEIQAVGKAYIKAFNKRDAKAVAAFWSPEAVYINRLTGEEVVGRKAIEEQFAGIFKAIKELKLEVNVDSIQFVSPNVAVEHGLAKFSRSGADPEDIDYSAVYVRRGGKWLLDRVTDEPLPAVASNYEHLKDLSWIIGNWVDEEEGTRIVTECNWTKNNNFITRSFMVSIEDRVEMSGMQIIGWDAAAKQIRSWTFDSSGGHAEGKWKRQGDRWFVHKSGTSSEGKKSAAVNIIKPIDEDSFTLQSVNRNIDGEILPNIDEIKVVRQ